MIEVIYKEEKQESGENEALFFVPRNIRQIGLINENYRIYIEDYVYTFLGKLALSGTNREEKPGCLAVLTGEVKWAKGTTYLFIQGALAVEDMEAAADHIDFTQDVWKKITEEKEKYFPQQEIVGWFFAAAQLPLEATENFTRAHLKHFAGDKVLMLMDTAEKEDAFFCYENGFMVRQSGYYIYYEKNPRMQTYMIEKKPETETEHPEEVPDEAVKSFRKIIREKNSREEEDEGHFSVFSYAATACLALAVLTVGVNFYRNYQDMEELNQQTAAVSAMAESEGRPEKNTITPTAVPKVLKNTSAPSLTQGQEEELSPSPSQAEELTQAASPENETQETAQNGEDSIYYQEESDTRKAKRRAELAARENEAASAAAINEGSEEDQDTRTVVNQAHDTYVIRPGDTLYEISVAKYGSMDAIAEICRLNNLTEGQIIYPGQVIVLP